MNEENINNEADYNDFLYDQMKDLEAEKQYEAEEEAKRNNFLHLEAKDFEKDIKNMVKDILECEYKLDQEKLISYLIFACQLYERKGGKKDLW